MPEVRIPAPRRVVADPETGLIARDWWRFFHDLWQRVGGEGDITVLFSTDEAIRAFEVTVAFGDLASAGSKTLLEAATGETWKITGLALTAAGTDFTGGGGDRLLAITDGTTTWSIIPAATLGTLAIARWGDAGMPDPGTPADFFVPSAESTSIVAQYSGGSADYAAGSCTIRVLAWLAT